MININFQWGEPYKLTDLEVPKWQRRCIIPRQYRNEFFSYWKVNNFKLKSKGYSVTKVDDEWFLLETHDELESFGKTQKKQNNDLEIKIQDLKNDQGLRPWQVEAVKKLTATIKVLGCAIDGSDLGIGKTYTACGVARELDMDILVVCPKAVMEGWKRVIKNHFKMWGRCVGIINYESLRMGKKDSNIASFVRRRDTRRDEFVWKIPKSTLIVWDESQKLKNPKTKNSETCISALKAGYKMLFCSATNATNPLELKTVGLCLKLFKNNKEYYNWLYDHGVSKGRFGFEFNGNKEVLKKLHKDIFVNRGVRLMRDTIENFPESEIIAECYHMEEEAEKKINNIYSEMHDELKRLESKIKKESKDSVNQLTAILRARQKIELVKVPLFLEMIEESLENNMSVVVFVNFTETINALSERLNTKCIVNGIVKDKDRQQAIDDFQSDKERIILVNISAGGAGLNLHDITGKYPRIALISPSYSAVQMRQATGRVWRDSSKTKSIQKIIFVANTIEEKVCEAVRIKLENLDLLNDGDLLI